MRKLREWVKPEDTNTETWPDVIPKVITPGCRLALRSIAQQTLVLGPPQIPLSAQSFPPPNPLKDSENRELYTPIGRFRSLSPSFLYPCPLLPQGQRHWMDLPLTSAQVNLFPLFSSIWCKALETHLHLLTQSASYTLPLGPSTLTTEHLLALFSSGCTGIPALSETCSPHST